MYESGLDRPPHRLLGSREDHGPVSDQDRVEIVLEQPLQGFLGLVHVGEPVGRQQIELAGRSADQRVAEDQVAFAHRSEEHTSELQSLAYLVCRLLLEKKKIQITSVALMFAPPSPTNKGCGLFYHTQIIKDLTRPNHLHSDR